MSKELGGGSSTEPDLSTLSGRLRLALGQRETNPNQVEIATGIKRQTIYAALRGQTQNFDTPTLDLLSNYLAVRSAWLAKGEGSMRAIPELRAEDEIDLIESFRRLSPTHQRDLLRFARVLADEETDPPWDRPFGLPKHPKQ